MALYAFNRREEDDLIKAEKELIFSIGKTNDLYHYLLLLVIDMADIAAERIEQNLRKNMPTPEDLSPNRRFAENQFIEQLRQNRELKNYVVKTGLSWANFSHVPRVLYNNLILWEPYIQYMNAPESGYQVDKKFISRLFTEFVLNSDELLLSLEEQSIFWNDDIEDVMVMIDKTIRRFKPGADENMQLIPIFKNQEDKDYVIDLFRKSVLNSKMCSELIDKNTTNWEVERIALMDILVMQMAITEVKEFEEIPVKVTLNEYIEIAKYYCTSKSSTFVNGILDNIFKEMRLKGLVKKTGRGLLGEPGSEKEKR